MITRDLMMGDYITFTDCQNDDAPVIIEIVGLGYQGRGVEEEALVCINGDKGCDLMEIDEEFCGIPLKVDMLKECGFGYEESDSELTHLYLGEPHFCKDMNLHIGTDRKGHFWLNYHDNSIYGLRYVHELQHAFRLLGIDIKIEL